MNTPLSLVLAACCANLLSLSAMASDCNKAQQLYQQGVDAGQAQKWQEAKNFLSQSVAECNTFQNWYRLGQVEQELKKYPDAASAYEDARRYAENSEQRALAVARYAEIRSLEGDIHQALTLLHEARRIDPNAPAWITQLARNLDKKRLKEPLTVTQVTRALTNRSIKLLNLDTKPNLNVSINFKTASVDVVEQSQASIEVLAQALVDQSMEGKTILIVGHADERGKDKYNESLSKKRAEHIAKELIQRQPSLNNRLATDGKGEKEPLYPGHTDEDYMLNRRIEVQVN